ncbi:MAG: D-aminoacyl-tRNA deacylase [Oleiphilaceae bacterium]|nr:D-aminoacyl-tRNA deacylase [Oleiphilaceae bacterium]
MQGLIQRVSSASVSVEGETLGAIGQGLLLFLAVEPGDEEATVQRLLKKVLGYRVFADDQGRMNRSLLAIHGELLVVSQFTLTADTRRGLRPSFSGGADPAMAERLYRRFIQLARENLGPEGLSGVASGRFAADMAVSLVNDGPVTFWLSA